MATAVPKYATKVLCANYGSMEYGELRRRVKQYFNFPDDRELPLANRSRFLVTEDKAASSSDGCPRAKDGRRVLAVTPLRLCKRFHSKEGCADRNCPDLHLCRFFVYGNCKFDKGRRRCNYSHDFNSEHNTGILKANDLLDLVDNELRLLLLQNDPLVLPEACHHYNKGTGYYGSCTFKEKCTKLHICQHFLHGTCKFGEKCKRSHNFGREVRNMLEEQGLGPDLILNLLSIYRNNYEIINSNSANHKELIPSIRQMSLSSNSDADSEEICLYYISKLCSFKEKCIRNHFSLPYRWQVLKDSKWEDLPNMQQIENAYCDPNNTSPGSSHIDFQKMICGSNRVRRLSTASSVTKLPHFILTTNWVWYWKDEFGKWIEYGSQAGIHDASTVTTTDLEKAYLENDNAVVSFQAGRHEYELKFKDMVQENKSYKTRREVRRRPKFVSAQDVESIKKGGVSPSKSIPAHWDKSAVDEVGYKHVPLSESSEEYKKIQALFQRTMPNTTIQKIERIQNVSLWEVFQWQKEQMKKRNGGKDIDEKLLFHGTEKSIIDAISQQNFDWRICGVHGTAYGKGSYFARDASYSHNYISSSESSRIMFVARVLVGQFMTGNSSYLRPPSKDGKPSNLYDSCVDNVSNPSIYVIFEKHQIYPEYLIKYCDKAAAATSHVSAASSIYRASGTSRIPSSSRTFGTSSAPSISRTSGTSSAPSISRTSGTSNAPSISRTSDTSSNPRQECLLS